MVSNCYRKGAREMNEKINVLWDQAVTLVEQEPDGDWSLDTIKDKFAELIVRECLNQIDKVDAMLDDDKEKTGVAWVGLAIVKHFGVEE